MSRLDTFRRRLRAHEKLVGTFVKIPHHVSVEILATAGLDFIVLDAEHAPFSASVLDRCLMAASLSDLPALVRVPALDKVAIGAALDMGAVGLIIPHIVTAGDAQAAIDAALYQEGSRGISAAHRGGGYGHPDLAAYAAACDRNTVIIGQLEDAAALAAVDQIAAVARLDGLFIGRADLMLSLGASHPREASVDDAVRAFEAAAQAARKPLGTFVNPGAQQAHLDHGYSFVAVGSDQLFLKTGASAIAG